jgi:hypothetical protein
MRYRGMAEIIKEKPVKESDAFRFPAFLILLILILGFVGFEVYFFIQTLLEY